MSSEILSQTHDVASAGPRVVEIPCFDDPRLDPYRSLKQTNATRWCDTFIAEGDKLLTRLLESDYQLDSVLLGRQYVGPYSRLVGPSADVLVIPDPWVEKLVGFNFHRGVLACGRRKPNPALAEVVPDASQNAVLVACDHVQNPENIGAILRTGAAFGVGGILLGPGCADPLSRRVLRVSMGAGLRLAIRQTNDLAADLDELASRHQFELWAAVLDDTAQALATLERPERLAILLGSEGHGLETGSMSRSHRRVTIPIEPHIDSLNVAVTASIFLYELLGR